MRTVEYLAFIVFVVAPMLVGANLLGQRLFPTKKSDADSRRFGYRLLVYGLMAALLLALIGVAGVFGL